MIKAIEYKTLKEYKEANLKAHKTLLEVKEYNSPMYGSENGILSINNTYLLPLIPKFKTELENNGFKFKEIDENYKKVIEIE